MGSKPEPDSAGDSHRGSDLADTLVVTLILLAITIALEPATGRDVRILVIERGDTYLLKDGVIEIWCEVKNYGGPGTGVVQAWLELFVDQDVKRFGEDRSIDLESLTGDRLTFRFEVPPNQGYNYGFRIWDQTNRDGSTPKDPVFGSWGEGFLMILYAVIIALVVYVGIRLYIRWVRKVTDVAEDHGASTRFKPIRKKSGKER